MLTGKGHWLMQNGKIAALVVCDCYGNRIEIGRGDLLGKYTPDQIQRMRLTLRTALSRQQSVALMAVGD